MSKRACLFISTLLLIITGSAGWCAESFYVGPGDVVEVSVWRDENLSRELIVTPDGILSFPLIDGGRDQGYHFKKIGRIYS